jgi:TolA-binding protein
MPDDIDNSVAEPIELRRFDLHGLWRVLLWGATAAMALAVVAGTAFSDLGAERLKQTVAALVEPAAKPQQQSVDPHQLAALEQQTRQLAQAVHDLTAERDAVKGRLAVLEQNLEDITGAIKRQAAQPATQKTADAAPKTPQKEAVAETPAPPVVSAPATVAAVPSPAPAAATPDAPAATASIEPAEPITGPIPLPRTRFASAMAKSEAGEGAVATTKQIGVDLGGAPSMDALRAHWAALKANVGPELVGLKPSVMTRQKLTGAADYRLVLVPIPNSATAIRLCAKLAASHVFCRAGTFNVEQLAER